METTKILWLSRHGMTIEQSADLNRIYGDIEIIQHAESVKNAKEVVDIAANHGCDVLAVVLPPNILSDLVNSQKKPVIRAKANRVPTGKKIINPATGNEEDEFKFEHAGWERVVKVEIITEDL